MALNITFKPSVCVPDSSVALRCVQELIMDATESIGLEKLVGIKKRAAQKPEAVA